MAGASTEAVASATANKENAPPTAQVVGERDSLFGARVRKSFGSRFFWGSVAGRYVVAGGAFYKVSFDDGDVDVFAASEVMEDVKQARRHANEDKLRPTEAGSSPQTPYQEEMRRPTLKRKRDESGEGDIRVRLWGQRLHASIYTSDDRQTYVKDFLPMEDGQPGELESSGLVNVGDWIIAVNGKKTGGMASWEISDVIRKARRPLWLVFARGDGTIPPLKPVAAGQDGTERASNGTSVNGGPAPAMPALSGPVTAPASSGTAHPSTGSGHGSTSRSGAPAGHAPSTLSFPRSDSARAGHVVIGANLLGPATATHAPRTTHGGLRIPSGSDFIVNRPSEGFQAPAGEPVHGVQPPNSQLYPEIQHSTPDHPHADALAAAAAANSKMLHLRDALLKRQQEQQERHERMHHQLHRMGPNMPTNGLAVGAPPPPVASAPRQAPLTQWNSHSHMASTALVPASSNNIAVAQATGTPSLLVATYPMSFTSWTSVPHQQGWSAAPAQHSYVMSNPAPPPVYSNQYPVARPRFEVVDGASEGQANARKQTPSPPQASTTHAYSNTGPTSSTEATSRTTSTTTAAHSATSHDEPELDMDDDAAAIAALAEVSPSKEASEAAPVPMSFLTPTTSSDSDSAETTAAPTAHAPMVEGDNYFVVTIQKPRLYVTLGNVDKHVAVTSFVQNESGETGEIEESGKVLVGDLIVGVNGVRLGSNMSPSQLAHLVNTTPRPMSMWFKRSSWDALLGST